MPSSHQKTSGPAKRIMMLAAAIVAAIALYAIGWHFVTGKITARADRAISSANAGGQRASCENLEARGFPFRIGIFCDSVLYENRNAGVFVTAGALRSASQVYRPALVRGEIDPPAHLEIPGLVPLDLTWQWLGASMRMSRPLPERLSLSATKLQANISEGYSFESGALFTAEKSELHMRPDGSNLDVAATFGGLVFSGSPGGMPFDGEIDIRIDDGINRLAGANMDPRGLSADIRKLALAAAAGGAISMTGPLAVGTDGLVDGEIEIDITDAGKLADALAEVAPAHAPQIRSLLGAANDNGDGNKAKLTLRLVKGKVFAGLFPLAQIPPL